MVMLLHETMLCCELEVRKAMSLVNFEVFLPKWVLEVFEVKTAERI